MQNSDSTEFSLTYPMIVIGTKVGNLHTLVYDYSN